MTDYSRYMHMEISGHHRCFQLVRLIFEDQGIDLGPLDAGADTTDQRVARLHDELFRLTNRVDEPQEGDVVLIRSAPWHVGVMMRPPYFIHCFLYGQPARGDVTSIFFRDRIEGFYRYAR